MFENPRRGREARNFTTNVPKILDLKSSSEQIFSENCRWVPLTCARGVGNLTRRAFPREGNLTFSRLGWGIWTRSVKFNLLSSFLCQTTLLQSNIFLVAKWRSTRKCQRNDVKMRFEQLCTSTCQPMTSCVLCTFPVWPTGNGNHLLCLCNSFAFMGEISALSYTLIWKGMLSWSSG